MFIVEIFENGNWELASTHTQEIDANHQKELFISDGIPEDQLRISEKEG